MTLCSRYPHSMETKFNVLIEIMKIKLRMMEAYLSFYHLGCGLGSQRVCTNVEKHKLDEAHIYILKICNEARPFIE